MYDRKTYAAEKSPTAETSKTSPSASSNSCLQEQEEEVQETGNGDVVETRKRKMEDTDLGNGDNSSNLKVNLDKLGTESLLKYCKRYNLEGVNNNLPREKLLMAVKRHFASQPPLDEKRALEGFAIAARRLKEEETGATKYFR